MTDRCPVLGFLIDAVEEIPGAHVELTTYDGNLGDLVIACNGHRRFAPVGAWGSVERAASALFRGVAA